MAWRTNIQMTYVLVILALAACRKAQTTEAPEPGPNGNNPEVLALPSSAFSLTATDTRAAWETASRRKTYALSFSEGAWSYDCNGLQTELTVQPAGSMNKNFANEILVTVSSEDPLFEGVNISSSNEAVDVEWTDGARTVFRLLCKGSGVSVVKVWNGDGGNALSFPVHSDVDIPLQGVLVEFRGERYELKRYGSMKEMTGDTYGKACTIREWLTEDNDCFERGVRFRILGPVPMNATEHNRLSIRDETRMFNGDNDDRMWSENEAKNPSFEWFTRRKMGQVPADVLIFPWELTGKDFVIFDTIGAESFYLQNYPFSDGSADNAEFFAIKIPLDKETCDWILSRE